MGGIGFCKEIITSMKRPLLASEQRWLRLNTKTVYAGGLRLFIARKMFEREIGRVLQKILQMK